MNITQLKPKKSLIEKLIQFGLDPEEWVIANDEPSLFDTFLLINKRDPEFRLVGERSRKGWKKLTLLSI